MQILDIFLLFGAPNILQSDNGAGKEDEVRPTFASTPNIALYGVRLIPEW
jgi:hypothetical protein